MAGLFGPSTVKMTERYAHLAPENLVDAVSSIEDWLHYGSTLDGNNKVTGEENHQVLELTDEKLVGPEGLEPSTNGL